MLVSKLKLNTKQFSEAIGVSNGYLAKQRANKANVGSHIIEKIVSVYPEVNLYWLIKGEGSMLREINKKREYQLPDNNFQVGEQSYNLNSSYEVEISKLNTVIVRLAKKNSELEQENEKLRIHRDS